MATQKSTEETAVGWGFIGILKSAAVQQTREGTSERGFKHTIPKSCTMGIGAGTSWGGEDKDNNFLCQVEYRTDCHQLANWGDSNPIL